MARNRDLDAILKAFEAIPKEARKPIKKAIDKGADELVNRMQYLAPEDDGDLKRSIQKVDLSDVATRVEAGGEATTREVRKGSGVYFDYSLAQEWGTADMPASPYFMPAVNTLKGRVRRRVDRAIGKAVKTAWEKN